MDGCASHESEARDSFTRGTRKLRSTSARTPSQLPLASWECLGSPALELHAPRVTIFGRELQYLVKKHRRSGRVSSPRNQSDLVGVLHASEGAQGLAAPPSQRTVPSTSSK